MRRFHRITLPAFLFLALFVLTAPVWAQSEDASAQAVALFQKGQDAHEKGEFATAVDLYKKALDLLPEFPEAELQLGNAYVSLGRPSEAEAAFRKALTLREDWSLASASLGSLLVTQKKYEDAAQVLKRSVEIDPMNPLALSAMADLLLDKKAPTEELRSHLSRMDAFAGKVRPPASLLASKAAIEERLGNRAGAKETASRALQIDPRSLAALSVLADIALTENDIEKADGYARNVEDLAKGDPATLTLRARVLFARGKKADALAALESIKDPSESIKEMIAKIKDGDVADLAGLEAKARRTPDDVNALAKLCTGFRIPDPVRALEYCRRASILEPNEVSHAVNFGAALVQAKRYEEAVGLFRKLLAAAPEHTTARANLATALFQLKLYPEAKVEFRWLTEKQPDSPAAYYFLAIIHDQLEEYLDAMANYQQFLKLADLEANKLEIEKVNLRLPTLQKQIKDGKGKKSR
jgi:tetratricopeptide (TPR) repeat protein